MSAFKGGPTQYGGWQQAATSVEQLRIAGPTYRANGLLIRGVVTAVYVTDSENGRPGEEAAPEAVYCDVLTYSGRPTLRWGVLERVLVAQDRGGIHEGRIWRPRATTMDVSGEPLQTPLNLGHNPANLDGDHVLIGFLDDDLNMPVILRGIPHPSADVGNAEADVGRRLRFKLVDGHPDFQKHRGSFYGIDTQGNFLIDLSYAHTGSYKDDPGSEGNEPGPDETDPAIGAMQVRLAKTKAVRIMVSENVGQETEEELASYELGESMAVALPDGGTVTIDIDGGPTFEISGKESGTLVRVGGGLKKVADADRVETLYASLKTAFDGHTHVQELPLHPAVPPTGPTGTPSATAPIWDPKINNSTVQMPDAL